MMYWTKDYFEFRDEESFGTVYRNLALRGSPLSPNQLSSVKFPIKVTHCDRKGVNGIVDANGTTWYSEDSYLFDNEDRGFFKKFVAFKPAVEKADAQQLLDCSHLLGRIYVDGKLVTKPGDLEKFLRKARETTLKDTEKRYDTATANLQRLSGELKVLRGE